MNDLQGEMWRWAKRNGMGVPKPELKKEKKKTEKLSERDLRELMNINAPTYHRGSGGAIRQK